MNDREAIEIMQRCKHEITSLRSEINRLKPKADAYDSVAQVLALLPRPSIGMGEDMVWRLDKRIREIEQNAENPVAGARELNGPPRPSRPPDHTPIA